MRFVKNLIKDHGAAIWLIAAVAGLLTFILLNDEVNFNKRINGGPGRNEIENKTHRLAQALGFSLDSLSVIYQQIDKDIEDRHSQDSLSPSTGGWAVVIGTPVKDVTSFSGKYNQIYRRYGYLQFDFTRSGKVQRIRTKQGRPNPTFVVHDSLLAAVRKVVDRILDYDLEQYKLHKVQTAATTPLSKDSSKGRGSRQIREDGNEGTVFLWKNKNKQETKPGEPRQLKLEVKPEFRRLADSLSRFEYGIEVSRFETEFNNESRSTSASSASNISILLTYASITLLILFVFIVGFRQIFKGQVDWRRATLIMTLSGFIFFLGRSIYLMDVYGTFLTGSAEAVVLVGQFVTSVIIGMFTAVAYIGWEALARSQNQKQVDLVDAFWRKKLFFRETGKAILTGFSVAFALAGGFALLLYLMDISYFQKGGLFSSSIMSSSYPWITLVLALSINVLLVCLTFFGVIFSFLQKWVKRPFWQYLLGTALIGFLMLEPALLFDIGTDYIREYLLLVGLGGFLLYVFNQYGIVTLSVSWVVFVSLLVTAAFWDSASAALVRAGWGHTSVLSLLFLFGAAAYRYGHSLDEMEGYIPEYEERLAHQMRVEKEIEIARESQFKLMPVEAPEVEGIDIYGFFMPSFEVGGDYFDYVTCPSTNGEQNAIAFTIADVSGKAMKAAMQAVFTSGLLLSRLHDDSPATILREISPTIYGRTDTKTFITCLIGRYEIANQHLWISNAGHCRPILKRNDQASFIYTEDPRLPLGVRPTVDYKEQRIKLQKGDFILLYSDGLPEATDRDGNHFGYDNLLELVEQLETRKLDSSAIAKELKRRIQKFSDHQLADDTTLICIKI